MAQTRMDGMLILLPKHLILSPGNLFLKVILPLIFCVP